MSSAAEKARYYARKAAHLCTRCGCALPEAYRLVECDACRAAGRERDKRHYKPRLRRRPQRLYLAVTPDDLELPLYVTDSIEDMAAWLGVVPDSVVIRISRCRHGRLTHKVPRLYSVELDDKEDDKDD